jgi:hypothetical protein
LPVLDAYVISIESEAGNDARTATPTAATAANAEITAATLLALSHFAAVSHTHKPATTGPVITSTAGDLRSSIRSA